MRRGCLLTRGAPGPITDDKLLTEVCHQRPRHCLLPHSAHSLLRNSARTSNKLFGSTTSPRSHHRAVGKVRGQKRPSPFLLLQCHPEGLPAVNQRSCDLSSLSHGPKEGITLAWGAQLSDAEGFRPSPLQAFQVRGQTDEAGALSQSEGLLD